MERPDELRPVEKTLNYARDLALELPPYTVAVVEIAAE